jgi:RNA polymerase sigma-70 factor (ECF subfamily)
VESVANDQAFEAERPRLVRLAARILRDDSEAEDVVQHAWLRWDRTDVDIVDEPAWLTTVTTRLCLDRLRARIPEPVDDLVLDDAADDPADDVTMAETVGVALTVVLDRLTPSERVAFVLHDSFGFDFATIAEVLETTPAAARKLASRARAKVRGTASDSLRPDWEVVDAFMAAAKKGDFDRLLSLLAPGAFIGADPAAILAGTPERIEGAQEVATFFNGSAQAALPAWVGDRAAAAWFHLGEAKVLFDFTLRDGLVQAITFRADPEVLAEVRVRRGDSVAR